MKKHIKSILFAVLLTSFAYAQAQEIQTPSGHFSYKGRIELLSAKKYEMVSLINQAGHERVVELKNSGWTCLQKSTTLSQCTIFAKNEIIPDALINQIQKKYNSKNFEFGDLTSIELVNEAPFLKEYDVFQKITSDSLFVEKYRMQLINEGPTKIQFEFNKNEKVYLNVTSENSISALESLTISKKNTSTLYFIQVNFDKE